MPQNTCIVFIYLPGEVRAVPAGELRFDEGGFGHFQYGQRYVKRPAALPVDHLLLPLSRSRENIPLAPDKLGAIRDAAPDFWGRLVMAKQWQKPPEELRELDCLLFENCCRVGNLDFRLSASSPEPQASPPAYAELASIMELAEAIEQEQILTPEQHKLLPLMIQGSSIGGARPKCTFAENHELWIAKFPSRHDRWSNARIEEATMRLAARCGIRIPELKTVPCGGKDLLQIKRFDRSWSALHRGHTRYGYFSALSLLGISEQDVFTFSYLTLADKMRSFAPQYLEELYRRMVFNILCRNTDDHPRNHGFLIRKGKVELSPAFDITPTPSRAGLSTECTLAMTVGTQGRLASLENALTACGRFGLQEDDARALQKAMVASFANWPEFFDNCGVTTEDAAQFCHTFTRGASLV